MSIFDLSTFNLQSIRYTVCFWYFGFNESFGLKFDKSHLEVGISCDEKVTETYRKATRSILLLMYCGVVDASDLNAESVGGHLIWFPSRSNLMQDFLLGSVTFCILEGWIVVLIAIVSLAVASKYQVSLEKNVVADFGNFFVALSYNICWC